MVVAVVTSTKASATRTAEERKNSSIRVEHETRSPNVHDQRRRTPGIDLLAQIADMDVDDIGLERKVVLPHFLKQHRPRDDPSGMAQEVLQESEFARQQLNPGVTAMYGLLDQVHFEITDVQLGHANVVETAQQGIH